MGRWGPTLSGHLLRTRKPCAPLGTRAPPIFTITLKARVLLPMQKLTPSRHPSPETGARCREERCKPWGSFRDSRVESAPARTPRAATRRPPRRPLPPRSPEQLQKTHPGTAPRTPPSPSLQAASLPPRLRACIHGYLR